MKGGYKQLDHCEFEHDAATGRVRCLFPNSRLISEETRKTITIGPWCISRRAAELWWETSETARQMREGNRPRRVS